MTALYGVHEIDEHTKRIDLVHQDPRAWFEAMLSAEAKLSGEVPDRLVWDTLNELCLRARGRSLDGLKHARR